MGDLVNTFSFSSSRARKVEACPRQLYLRVFLSWGGWERDAEPRKRFAYALSKATGLSGLVGTIVHDTQAALVRAAANGEPDLQLADETERGIRRFDSAVQDAIDRRWETSPKHRPIVTEVLYDDPKLHFKRSATRAKLDRCIRNLFDSRYLTSVRGGLRAGMIELLAADDIRETIPVDVDGSEVPVWVVMDLALRTKGEAPRYGVGELKTGKPGPADAKQVGLYAHALATKYATPIGSVSVTTNYVADSREEPTKATEEMVESGLGFIRSGVRTVRDLLVDGDLERNEPRPEEAWPARVGPGCAWCDQRGVCSAYAAAGGKVAA